MRSAALFHRAVPSGFGGRWQNPPNRPSPPPNAISAPDALSFLFQSQSLEASLSIIPPFFNHIYAILTYPRGENSLSDMAELSLEAEGVAAPSVVLFKKRSSRPKGNIRKRLATPISSQTDDTSDYPSSEDDWLQRHRVKRRHQNTGVIIPTSTKNPSTELFPTVFQADRNVPLNATNDATKRSNWFDENTKIGPTQASTNVRITTVTDFAPDACKDYKTTGWCGFGDSCKFLHDRGDYKQGWQLDREWENVTKGKKNLGGTVIASANRNKAEDDEEDEEMAMLESIPFACFICKEAYKSPVITRCGHYFCESCALKRYTRDPTCAACGASTNGVFNSASKLKKLLERKRKRAAKKR
jgi:RING finger protein 113A